MPVVTKSSVGAFTREFSTGISAFNRGRCRTALYQAIQRLEREGLIAGARTERVDARRGRSYRLLPPGKAAVQAHLRRLSRVVDYARARRLLPEPRS
jgi:hypothetical protein